MCWGGGGGAGVLATHIGGGGGGGGGGQGEVAVVAVSGNLRSGAPRTNCARSYPILSYPTTTSAK